MGCIIHKWNGCRCEKCRKVRDKEHNWNGCKCRICGKTRDEGHKYIYRERYTTVNGVKKNWCERECRICESDIFTDHDYQPTEKKCVFRCSRCKSEIVKHDFKPVEGKCAEVCVACGEEIDYLKIALNEDEPDYKRILAVNKLKEASMMPDTLINNCTDNKHIWAVTKENPQRFQGGASSTVYTCAVCGKTNTDVDWGD